MWAYAVTRPRELTLGSYPEPGPEDLTPGGVLLEVVAGGICGSDLPVFNGRSANLGTDDVTADAAAPGVPAHEVVGKVVASRHQDHGEGEVVVGWATRWNGLSELLITRGDDVIPANLGLDPSRVVMLQPLACVLYAIDRIGGIEGANVAILGLGPIGLLFAHTLKSRGAGRVIGVDRIDRSRVATAFGLDETIHATIDRWTAALKVGDRPEIVVEAIGHQGSTLQSAVEAVADRGQIYYFGIVDDRAYSLDLGTFVRKNLTMAAGVARDRRRYLLAARSYVEEHSDLPGDYVTTTLPIDQIQQAFETADAPSSDRIKVTFSV